MKKQAERSKFFKLSPGVFRDPEMACVRVNFSQSFKYREAMDCGTGCREPQHMMKCFKCGCEYHVGTVHQCQTGTVKQEDFKW